MTMSSKSISRVAYRALLMLLIAVGALGVVQSVVAPYGIGYLGYGGRWRADAEISSQNLIMRWQVNWRMLQGLSSNKGHYISTAPRRFVGFHPSQLMPKLRISHPYAPIQRSVSVTVHVPYASILLLSLALEWLRRRRLRRRRLGFPVRDSERECKGDIPE